VVENPSTSNVDSSDSSSDESIPTSARPSTNQKRQHVDWWDSSDDDLLASYARRFANQNQPVQNDGEIPSTSSSSVPIRPLNHQMMMKR
jgi:hypothetical protein